MSTVPAPNGRVQAKDSTVPAGKVEKLYHAPAFQIAQQAAEFVERVSNLHGSKEVAAAMDLGYSAFRRWVGEPERIPLVKIPDLHRLAPPGDHFWSQLNLHLGFKLLPVEPTAEEIINALDEAGAIKRGKAKTARRVVRGLRRDDRQSQLWVE